MTTSGERPALHSPASQAKYSSHGYWITSTWMWGWSASKARTRRRLISFIQALPHTDQVMVVTGWESAVGRGMRLGRAPSWAGLSVKHPIASRSMAPARSAAQRRDRQRFPSMATPDLQVGLPGGRLDRSTEPPATDGITPARAPGLSPGARPTCYDPSQGTAPQLASLRRAPAPGARQTCGEKSR